MVDVKMPQLGESVTEGTLGKWLKQVGDQVSKYEPLVEVVTDKVNAEIPSDYDGILTEILVNEGETVHIGTVIGRIREQGDDSESPQDANPTSLSEKRDGQGGTVSAPDSDSQGGSMRYSPAVLRLAEEHQIHLTEVEGTGEGGRITRKDVLAYVNQRESASAAPRLDKATVKKLTLGEPNGSGMPAETNANVQGSDIEADIIPASPIRRTIAKRMVESKRTAPHAWTMVEADVTHLSALREQVKAEFRRREGIDLTYLPFFIKAVVEGLKQFPMMNASWVDDTIVVKKQIHISLAVATDEALVVPVIHHADRLSITGLAHAIYDLATRARSGRLKMEDVQGGTFTVNNTGAFGSVLSQPIIPAPQAGIVTMESIVKRPVVVNDGINIRSMVNLCLSLDHRVLDGWIAGQFLKAVKERLQGYDRDTNIF